MAKFTSVKNGQWTSADTWDLSSDFPKSVNDEVDIYHNIRYNHIMDGTVKSIWIRETGSLSFDRTCSCCLNAGVGNNVGVTMLGGTFNIGTESLPIIKPNFCIFSGNIQHYSDASISFCGDPNYYGNYQTIELVSDWTSENVIDVYGDHTNLDGKTIYLFNLKYYSDFSAWADCTSVTVSSSSLDGTNTNLELFSTADSTFFSGSLGIIFDRNIIYARSEQISEIAPGNYFDYSCCSIFGSGTVNLKDICLVGTYIRQGNVNIKNCIFLSSQYGINNVENIDVSSTSMLFIDNGISESSGTFLDINIAKCDTGISYNSSDIILSGNVLFCNNGLNHITDSTIEVNVFSNNNGYNTCDNLTVDNNVYLNVNGFYQCSNIDVNSLCLYNNAVTYMSTYMHFKNDCYNNTAVSVMSSFTNFRESLYNNSIVSMICINNKYFGNIYSNGIACYSGYDNEFYSLGYDNNGDSSPNSVDFNFAYPGQLRTVLMSSRAPEVGISFGESRNDELFKGEFCAENFDMTYGKNITWDCFGTIENDTNILRPTGAPTSIKVTPLSNCGSGSRELKIFEWSEYDVETTEQSRSIYAKCLNWSTFPTKQEFYLCARYYGSDSNLDFSSICSEEIFTSNDTWTNFSVKFTPKRIGEVLYTAFLKTYDTEDSVIYVDGQLILPSNRDNYIAKWSRGKSTLVNIAGMYLDSSREYIWAGPFTSQKDILMTGRSTAGY